MNHLNTHLKEKIACLNRLEKLGKEQLQALKSNSIERLGAILKERARLAQKIDNIDQAIEPRFRNLPAHEKARFSSQIETMKTVLHRLAALEKESAGLAQNEMSRLQGEIKQTRQSNRAVKGYAQTGRTSTSRFLDMKR